MTTLTITAKGQITLKKELLRALGAGPGDKVEVTPAPRGGLSIAAVRGQRSGRMSDAFGMLAQSGSPPLSIEEMNEAIADDRAQDDARIMAEVRAARR